jgi:hypothetical protein
MNLWLDPIDKINIPEKWTEKAKRRLQGILSERYVKWKNKKYDYDIGPKKKIAEYFKKSLTFWKKN